MEGVRGMRGERGERDEGWWVGGRGLRDREGEGFDLAVGFWSENCRCLPVLSTPAL